MSSLPQARTIRIDGPAGVIEALYRPPAESDAAPRPLVHSGNGIEALATGAPRRTGPASPTPGGPPRAAVLCHPHPLYGGTMHNRVISQLEKALAAAGRATMRFNFRGAGSSAGPHDEGRGEADDVRVVADELVRRVPGATLDVLGYSFGCWVSWRALGQDPRTRSLTGVGVPLRTADFAFASALRPPITIVQGEDDEFGSGAEIRALAASFPAPPRLIIIPGADHLFTRGYERLLAAIPLIVSGM